MGTGHSGTEKMIEKTILELESYEGSVEKKRKLGLVAQLIKANKDKTIRNSKTETIQYMFNNEEAGTKVTTILLSKKCYLIYITDKKKKYITSDYPVYIHGDNGIIAKSTSVITTLSNKVALLFMGQGETIEYMKGDSDLIKMINGMILANADNLVISSNKKLLQKMISWKKGESSKFKFPRHQIYPDDIEISF